MIELSSGLLILAITRLRPESTLAPSGITRISTFCSAGRGFTSTRSGSINVELNTWRRWNVRPMALISKRYSPTCERRVNASRKTPSSGSFSGSDNNLLPERPSGAVTLRLISVRRNNASSATTVPAFFNAIARSIGLPENKLIGRPSTLKVRSERICTRLSGSRSASAAQLPASGDCTVIRSKLTSRCQRTDACCCAP